MQPENRREHFTAYAETLHRRLRTGILADLQERILWVVWKPEKDQRGNIHKRPFTPIGYPASIYKPRQCASIDTTLEALSTGNFAGIGVMLPAPLVLIDKDAKPDAPGRARNALKILRLYRVFRLSSVWGSHVAFSSCAKLTTNFDSKQAQTNLVFRFFILGFPILHSLHSSLRHLRYQFDKPFKRKKLMNYF